MSIRVEKEVRDLIRITWATEIHLGDENQNETLCSTGN